MCRPSCSGIAFSCIDELATLALRSGVLLEGLVLVKLGREYTGVLTAWNDEEELLWQYLRLPTDAFSLEVVASSSLDRPCRFFAASGPSQSLSLVSSVILPAVTLSAKARFHGQPIATVLQDFHQLAFACVLCG